MGTRTIIRAFDGQLLEPGEGASTPTTSPISTTKSRPPAAAAYPQGRTTWQ